jgi:transcriptional regulator with XRE-family HTH domain
MKLGEKIARQRMRLGWSQNELARRAAINHPTLHRIESGKTVDPSVSIVVKIARTLGVSVEDLMGPEISPIPPSGGGTGSRSEAAARRALEGAASLAEALTEIRKQLRQIYRRLEELEGRQRKRAAR